MHATAPAHAYCLESYLCYVTAARNATLIQMRSNQHPVLQEPVFQASSPSGSITISGIQTVIALSPW
jgi:hypothetical protein